MAAHRNPNVSDLHFVPGFSGDPPPRLFYNSVHGSLTAPSPDIFPSSPNPGINVGQDQGQVDRTDTDFFIEIEDDFSVDWDLIDMEEKQEERRARKRIMDKEQQKRLSKGFAVLRSLLPKTGSTKKNLEFELSGALDYMKELKENIENLQKEFQSELATNFPLQLDMMAMNRSQPMVEVITDDSGNVNIHMSCESRPNILRTVMNSLDHLKIDAQQANATCFDWFQLDILNAKQCNVQFLKAEDIKCALMLCAQGA